MSYKNSGGKVATVIRILELFAAYRELSAGKILEKLVAEGYMKPSSRRLLNYYLEELGKLNILELKGKGRGAKWVLKRDLFGGRCKLDNEQQALIYLAFLSLPDLMAKDLKEDISTLFNNLGIPETAFDTMGRDIHIKYLWGISPQKQLFKIAKILRAISEHRYINLAYEKRKNELRRLLPIGITLRKGKLYLTAIDRDGKRKTFALERIIFIELSTKTYSGKYYPQQPFYAAFEDREKAFVFGVEVNKPLPAKKEYLTFSPLIFHHEIEGNVIKKIYLVGFTGDYFASRFMLFVYGKLIPPSADMLNIARKRRLNNIFHNLELANLSENLNRFSEFVKALNYQLLSRLQFVNLTLTGLENINPS